MQVINKSFSTVKTSRYIDYMLNNNLAYIKDNHLFLVSVHNNESRYYKSKIKYSEGVTYKDIQEKILLEVYKFEKFNQEKAINLRSEVTNQQNKQNKRKVSKRKMEAFNNLGESYYDKAFITYSGISKKVNLSIRTVFYLTQRLIKKGLLQLETIVINHKLRVYTDIETIKDELEIKHYTYSLNGFLYSIIGSEIKFI